MESGALSSLDWGIIVAYGVGMLLVGFYYSRKNKTAEDYLLGGRNLNASGVGISLYATMFSAISYLAYPGEIISYGPMIILFVAAFPFIYLAVAYLFIPFIMKTKVTSAYQLLEHRLGLPTRLLAASFFLIMRFLWMALIIYMVAEKVIIPVMGWSHEHAILVSVALGVITVTYTSAGGLRGVVFTDIVQSLVMLGGLILAIILVVADLGSVSALIPTQWPENWAGWVFYDPGVRVSFVTVFLSTFGWYVFTAGSDQMSIQRFVATKDIKSARQMYMSNLVMNGVVSLLLVVMGMGFFALMQTRPELLGEGLSIADGADSVFPRFIAFGLPAGFSGIVIAGLLAAAMSSLSSGINSSSLTIINDFILRFRSKDITEANKVKLATIVSSLIGILTIVLSLVIGRAEGNLLELTYKTTNLLVAPLFVPFFMAMFVSRASPMGTFIGTLASAITAVLIAFSSEIFAASISFLWITPGSFFVGVVLSFFLSLLAANDRST